MSARPTDFDLPPLHDGQQAVLSAEARFKVVIAGRQWGKTMGGSLSCLEAAAAGGRAWWVAPTYKTADEGWEPIQALANQIPGREVVRDERRVTLPGGGRVEVRSADQPDSLRGAKLDHLVLDEFCYMPERVWTYVLRPTLAVKRGTALFISTPNGTGTWGHRLYTFAQSKEGQRAGWRAWRFPSWTNPHFGPDEVAAIRAQTHPLAFAQEYGAEFVSLIMLQPFKADWIVRYQPDELPPPLSLDVSIGIDLAISKRDTADQTALVAVGAAIEGPMRGYSFVLQAEAGHWSPYETADRVFSWIRRWRPRRLVIETVAYQRAFADIMTRESQVRGLPIPHLELQRPELDKLRRAMRLSPSVERGMLLFGPGQDALIAALLAVPEDKRGWDWVDALGLAATFGPRYRPASEPLSKSPVLGPAVDPAARYRAAMASYGRAQRTTGSVTPVAPRAQGPRRKLLAEGPGVVTLLPGPRRGGVPVARARGYARRPVAEGGRA